MHIKYAVALVSHTHTNSNEEMNSKCVSGTNATMRLKHFIKFSPI